MSAEADSSRLSELAHRLLSLQVNREYGKKDYFAIKHFCEIKPANIHEKMQH